METILIVTGIVVAAVLVYLYVIRKNKDTATDVEDIYIDESPVEPVDEASITTSFDETAETARTDAEVANREITKRDELLS